MLELFGAAGVPALVAGYLGEPALISVQKTTLRKAEPTVGGAWHQDGAFMGEVRVAQPLARAVALRRRGARGWTSSRAGSTASSPRGPTRRCCRYQVSQRKAEEAAGDTPIVRPIFEPGDALFFDELFLHQTGSDPSMPNPRFAIENWFFGASGLPARVRPGRRLGAARPLPSTIPSAGGRRWRSRRS